jgi:sugar (pentulose or hexulose) kinase
MNTSLGRILLLILLLLCSMDKVSGLQQHRHFCGLDLGTSGCRLSVIDQDKQEVYAQAIPYNGGYDDPKVWMEAVTMLLQGASEAISLDAVVSMCVSGTSAS